VESSKKYLTFIKMIVVSMIAMYGVSYLNCAEAGDFRWSETRLYMNLMMGSAMTVIMLLFMLQMYSNKYLNRAIFCTSVVIFGVSLFLVRSQAPIHDLAYMRGMIPHHSIAILTSQRAKIRDQRVRDLANHIAESQRREIIEMNRLINEIKKNGVVTHERPALSSN
jgi:hypothetical protein